MQIIDLFRQHQNLFPFFTSLLTTAGFTYSTFFSGLLASTHFPFFSGTGFARGGGVNTAFLGYSFFISSFFTSSFFTSSFFGYSLFSMGGGVNTLFLTTSFCSVGGTSFFSSTPFFEPIAHLPPVSCLLSFGSFYYLMPSRLSKTFLDFPKERGATDSDSLLITGAEEEDEVVVVVFDLKVHDPFFASSASIAFWLSSASFICCSFFFYIVKDVPNFIRRVLWLWRLSFP